jgi:flagellar hook assembly protein FlgD
MKKSFIVVLSALLSACFAFAGAGKISVTSIDISPNPFSPGKGVSKISYGIDTTTGALNVRATIMIYNAAGKVVRTVLYNGLRSTTAVNNVDSWDGRDDRGKMCMNGRYILRIEVEDAVGKKQNLYSIVLAK